MLATLRRRDFALLWLGGLISLTGDWVLYAALPFYVYDRTGSTVATAGMIVAALAPDILLGSVAGVFVDRWDRKRVMVVSNLLQAVVVLGLLLVRSDEWLWVVYAAALAQSAIGAFFGPAEAALLPSLVGEERLVQANSLNSLNNRLARLVGFPLGGTLLAWSGLGGVILLDSASFLIAAAMISLIAARPRAVRGDATTQLARSAWARVWEEWVEGLRIVRGVRAVAILFVVLGVMTFGGTMLDPLYAPFVRDVLGGSARTFGWLLTAHALSGIVGGLLVGRFASVLSPRSLMGWGSITAGLLLLLEYNLATLPVAVTVALLVGVTSVASSVGSQTLLQTSTPDEYRGRIFGALGTTGALMSLLGAALGGVLAEVFGLVPMLNVAASLTALAGVVVLLLLPSGATHGGRAGEAEEGAPMGGAAGP